MDKFTISVKPQYVKLTDEEERIGEKICKLHEVQRRLKVDFLSLPEFTIITAPTGTGKSYAFPFPVLRAAQHSIDKVRGLIVLPTNALISELTDSFKQTYEKQHIVINQLTGPELDKYDLRGLKRWEKAIDIAESSNLIITNPDLLNYAMHGGYHKWAGYNRTGMTRFSRFLSAFNFIIFDEYHLYDEAQIANILTLIKLRTLFLQHYTPQNQGYYGIRFLFVSATPEKGLTEILDSEGLEYEEIKEEIVSEPENTRQIHGTLEVEFVLTEEIQHLIREKIPELKSVLEHQKALLILDRVRDVQELANSLESEFPAIYQSTGYVSKYENHKEKIESSNLIIATNKAEVGVNYGVEYCIMQPGSFYQNFVQRFGRISRGEKDGKIVIAIEGGRNFRKLKKVFQGQGKLSYYDFLDIMQERLQGKKFYSERVPWYLGEYMWCIQNSIRRFQEYDVWLYLKRRMNEENAIQSKVAQRFILFQQIDNKIRDLIKATLHISHVSKIHKHFEKTLKQLEKQDHRVFQWVEWWHNYLDTYLTFRDGSKVVKIYDRIKGEELEYSLDWILQHKIVEEVIIEQTEPYEITKYVVGDLKEVDRDIQYTVSTIPNAGKTGNNFLSYSDLFKLEKVFKRAVLNIQDKVKNGIEDTDSLQLELLKLIMQLALTFDRKRLTITDIQNDDSIL